MLIRQKNIFEKRCKRLWPNQGVSLSPNGIGVVVFAHKSTSGWEAQIQAMIDAGWIITGSWPIDTEMAYRLRAQNTASSSVHLICRPRENPDGSLREMKIGDWRDVLAELPKSVFILGCRALPMKAWLALTRSLPVLAPLWKFSVAIAG